VARQNDLAATANLPQDFARLDRAAVHADSLAALQPAEVGTRLDAELARPLLVEAPRPVVLDDHVAVGAHSVLDQEWGDQISVPLERDVRLELGELQLVPGGPDDRPERLEQRAQA